jgi:hypothetical protein
MKRKIIVGAVAGVVLVVSAPPLLPPILKSKPQVKERTQATMAEKKANRALAKQYAWAGYGWRNMEWRCLDYILLKRVATTILPRTNKVHRRMGLVRDLRKLAKTPQSKSFTHTSTSNTDTRHLVKQ